MIGILPPPEPLFNPKFQGVPMEKRRRQLAFRSAACLLGLAAVLGAAGPASAETGQIIRLQDGEAVPFRTLAADLAQADIVLVGEQHDDFAHHRAQQEVIAGILARRPVVVGMETFPAEMDGKLDGWRSGDFGSWAGFLDAVDWYRIWSIDPALYRPVLDTVRTHHLPLVGINVPRDWIGAIAREGMETLSEKQRDRIGPVAPPDPEYREALHESLSTHGGERRAGDFIAAQTAWDAAMAGALLRAHRRHPDAVVVGLAGNGHLEGGFGIPHQLRARQEGLAVRTVILYSLERAEPPGAGDGDFGWSMARDPAPKPVRIGVMVGQVGKGEDGVPVEGIVEGHPAARAGVREGDRLLSVDGEPTDTTTSLIRAIRQHRWGGCLLLEVRRNGEAINLTLTLRKREDSEGSPH